ncbi:MAG: integrin alpha [Planctomycetota bacterium]
MKDLTRFLVPILLAGVLPATSASGQEVSAAGGLGDQLGWSVAGLGDVDGDGFPDLALGAVQKLVRSHPAPGYVRILSGFNGALLHEINGSSPRGEFGSSVAELGDLDGDGFSDFVIGARYDREAGPRFGAARVYSGKNAALLFFFGGDSAEEEFGQAVAGAGDVNADGTPDIIVGAPRDDTVAPDSGSAFVFSGRTGELLYILGGRSSGDRFGQAVAGVGDVDGDGFADIAVGAPLAGEHSEGEFHLFSGKDGTVLQSFTGNGPGASLGWSLASAGDLDQDGRNDLAVGAPGEGAGHVYVFSGRDGAVLLSFSGDEMQSRFGAAVSGAGDYDRDEIPDVVVGAPRAGHGAGEAVVLSGRDGSLLRVFQGGAGDQAGFSVGALTEQRGSRILVGSPLAGGGAGRVEGYAPAPRIASYPSQELPSPVVYAYGSEGGSATPASYSYVTNNYYYEDDEESEAYYYPEVFSTSLGIFFPFFQFHFGYPFYYHTWYYYGYPYHPYSPFYSYYHPYYYPYDPYYYGHPYRGGHHHHRNGRRDRDGDRDGEDHGGSSGGGGGDPSRGPTQPRTLPRDRGLVVSYPRPGSGGGGSSGTLRPLPVPRTVSSGSLRRISVGGSSSSGSGRGSILVRTPAAPTSRPVLSRPSRPVSRPAPVYRSSPVYRPTMRPSSPRPSPRPSYRPSSPRPSMSSHSRGASSGRGRSRR